MIKKVTVGVAFIVASSLFTVGGTIQAKTSYYKVLSNQAVTKKTYVHYKNKNSYVWNYLPKTTKKAHKTHNLFNYKKTNFVVTRKAKVSSMGTYYKIKGSEWSGWINTKDVHVGKMKVTNQKNTIVPSSESSSAQYPQPTTQTATSQVPAVQQTVQAQSNTNNSESSIAAQMKKYGWSGKPIVIDKNTTSLNDIAVPDAIKGQTFESPDVLRTVLIGLLTKYGELTKKSDANMKFLYDEQGKYKEYINNATGDEQIISQLNDKVQNGQALTDDENEQLQKAKVDEVIQHSNAKYLEPDMEQLNKLIDTEEIYNKNYLQLLKAVDGEIWQ